MSDSALVARPFIRHQLGAALRFVDAFTGKPVDGRLDVRANVLPLPLPPPPARVPNLPWVAVHRSSDATYRFIASDGVTLPIGPLEVLVDDPDRAYVNFEPFTVTLPRPIVAHPPTPDRSDFLVDRRLWPTRKAALAPGETAIVGRIVSTGGLTPIAGLQIRLGVAPLPADPYTYTNDAGECLFRLPGLKGKVVGTVVTSTAPLDVGISSPPRSPTTVISDFAGVPVRGPARPGDRVGDRGSLEEECDAGIPFTRRLHRGGSRSPEGDRRRQHQHGGVRRNLGAGPEAGLRSLSHPLAAGAARLQGRPGSDAGAGHQLRGVLPVVRVATGRSGEERIPGSRGAGLLQQRRQAPVRRARDRVERDGGRRAHGHGHHLAAGQATAGGREQAVPELAARPRRRRLYNNSRSRAQRRRHGRVRARRPHHRVRPPESEHHDRDSERCRGEDPRPEPSLRDHRRAHPCARQRSAFRGAQ